MNMDKEIRILIVEDEYLIAFSFKRELERMGYEVLEPVAHGQEAIEIAARERPGFFNRCSPPWNCYLSAMRISKSLSYNLFRLFTSFRINKPKYK